MAHFVLKDASVTINAVDLSAHVREVTIDYEAEIEDDTAMGDDSRNKLPALKNATFTIEWAQDFAAAAVDATLFSLVGAAAFAFSIKPTSAAVSATNPNFNGNALLRNYQPLAGRVGVLATTRTTFEVTGDLARSTS